MYALETINRLNDKATRRAKHHGVRPLVATEDRQELTGIPTLGDYIPRGWKLVETLFVDSSGFGSDFEPSLSHRQFVDSIKKGYGYAVVKAGQFQVYVGVFKNGR